MTKDIATIKIKPQSLDKNIDPDGFDSPLGKRLLVISKETHTADTADRCGDGTFEPCHPTYEDINDCRKPTSPCNELVHTEHADSAVTMLHWDKLCPLSDKEADMNASVLEAALSQAFSMNPVVMVTDDPTDTEGSGYGYGEHVSTCEHSYSRPDTDKHQLWSKIFSLHAKILDLDRKEESTVAKIHALETEISHLKRDNAVCKEKQKILEDIISSKLTESTQTD